MTELLGNLPETFSYGQVTEFSTVVDHVIAFADGCFVQPVSPHST